ncbi:hypothetical protein RRG08_047659 [Elysia crispata]|uniref:Uncharacterized protein n=1 Tax=Elysia crispata TaxID=231223 RepID=A0AAE1BD44_9GAST|nr:hypothetical protein RRG08_047659 [Elysia crispata]
MEHSVYKKSQGTTQRRTSKPRTTNHTGVTIPSKTSFDYAIYEDLVGLANSYLINTNSSGARRVPSIWVVVF